MQRFLTVMFSGGLGISLGTILAHKDDWVTWATLGLSVVGLALTIFFRQKKKK